MAEILPLFNSDTSCEDEGLHHVSKPKKPRTNRTADFHLKKMDILTGLTYTEGNCGVPIIMAS